MLLSAVAACETWVMNPPLTPVVCEPDCVPSMFKVKSSPIMFSCEVSMSVEGAARPFAGIVYSTISYSAGKPDDPTYAQGAGPLVEVIASGPLIVMLSWLVVAVLPTESVTFMVNCKVPAIVGVPEMIPVDGLMVKGDRDPVATANA